MIHGVPTGLYSNDEPLPHIPFHGLRHTSAALLITQHQDIKTVFNRLGHAQTSTTMNTCAHALQDRDQCASDALASLTIKNLLQYIWHWGRFSSNIKALKP